MALNDLKDKKDEQIEQPQDDGKDHLRADLMGSMVKNDPSQPGYLGKMDHFVTGMGAVDKMLPPDSIERPAKPGSNDYKMATGATSQPKLPSSRMATAEAPAMGGGAPTAPPDMTSPLMGPAKPQQGFLGKIGHIAARMGNIAGDVLAPGVTALIPRTDLNKKFEAQRAERTAERQRQLDIEQQRADTEKLGVTQRPELVEEKGRIQGEAEARKAAEQEKLLTQKDTDTATREREREAASQKAQAERESAAADRQHAQFVEQEKQQDKRFAEQEKLLSEKLTDKASPLQKGLIQNTVKDVATANSADFRFRSMNDSYPKALKGDQQAMMNLLTNHIGMTLGLQKGARITKDILREAQTSTPWLQGLEAKFDDRGYLSGLTLTPEQMGQMMDLAKSQRVDAWQQVSDSAKQADVHDQVKYPDDLKGQFVTGPETGTVVRGYRFKGGDPKDKKNWEKVSGRQQ